MVAGLIPPCARPLEAPTRSSVDALLASLNHIHIVLGEDGFPQDKVLQLKLLAQSSLDAALPFQWDQQKVKDLFGAVQDGPQVNYQPTDSYRSLPFQVAENKYYLVNPADDKEPDDDMYACVLPF